jgi:hypothetical protein
MCRNKGFFRCEGPGDTITASSGDHITLPPCVDPAIFHRSDPYAPGARHSRNSLRLCASVVKNPFFHTKDPSIGHPADRSESVATVRLFSPQRRRGPEKSIELPRQPLGQHQQSSTASVKHRLSPAVASDPLRYRFKLRRLCGKVLSSTLRTHSLDTQRTGSNLWPRSAFFTTEAQRPREIHRIVPPTARPALPIIHRVGVVRESVDPTSAGGCSNSHDALTFVGGC